MHAYTQCSTETAGCQKPQGPQRAVGALFTKADKRGAKDTASVLKHG